MKESEILDQEIKPRKTSGMIVALLIIGVSILTVLELKRAYEMGLTFNSLVLIPCALLLLFFWLESSLRVSPIMMKF
jgi:hypothetical protein